MVGYLGDVPPFQIILEFLFGPLNWEGFFFHGGVFLFSWGPFSADVKDWCPSRLKDWDRKAANPVSKASVSMVKGSEKGSRGLVNW